MHFVRSTTYFLKRWPLARSYCIQLVPEREPAAGAAAPPRLEALATPDRTLGVDASSNSARAPYDGGGPTAAAAGVAGLLRLRLRLLHRIDLEACEAKLDLRRV